MARRVDSMSDQKLTALRAELEEKINSWAFAWAHAHGCSMGPSDPRLDATVDRVRDLRAMIEEHSS
jgi:hypothetical protein